MFSSGDDGGVSFFLFLYTPFSRMRVCSSPSEPAPGPEQREYITQLLHSVFILCNLGHGSMHAYGFDQILAKIAPEKTNYSEISHSFFKLRSFFFYKL